MTATTQNTLPSERWHHLNPREITQNLDTNLETGLSSAAIASKREIFGANELVPGDIVLLTSGDKVPADLRLVKANNLQINESALTGESLAVEKNTRSLDPDTPRFGRKNPRSHPANARSRSKSDFSQSRYYRT
jgi:P-type E1-E2 ATPase